MYLRISGLIKEEPGPGEGGTGQHAYWAAPGQGYMREDAPPRERSSRASGAGPPPRRGRGPGNSRGRGDWSRGRVSRQCHPAARRGSVWVRELCRGIHLLYGQQFHEVCRAGRL